MSLFFRSRCNLAFGASCPAPTSSSAGRSTLTLCTRMQFQEQGQWTDPPHRHIYFWHFEWMISAIQGRQEAVSVKRRRPPVPSCNILSIGMAADWAKRRSWAAPRSRTASRLLECPCVTKLLVSPAISGRLLTWTGALRVTLEDQNSNSRPEGHLSRTGTARCNRASSAQRWIS